MLSDDPDEIPVSGNQKSFEELLEEKLREAGNQPVVKRNVPKREFLRRKTSENDRDVEIIKNYIEEDKPIVPKMKRIKSVAVVEAVQEKPGIKEKEVEKKQFLKRGEGKSCLAEKKVMKEVKKDEGQSMRKTNSQKYVQKVPEVKEVKVEEPKVMKPAQTKASAKTTHEEIIYYDPTALHCDSIDITPKIKEEPKVINPAEEAFNEGINELNFQIERFKSQAIILKAENKDIKSKIQLIDNDYNEFIEKKSQRIQELNIYKENEFKRIKKERMNLEKNMKVAQPTKNEEIEELRLSLFKNQEEIAIKEFKDKENLENLTSELAELNDTLAELEAQVRIREQLLIKEKFTKKSVKPSNEKSLNDGTKVKQLPDGRRVIYYANGDIKETHPDGKVILIYNDDQSTQTTFPDGTTVFEFSNGKIEKTFKNGTKEITFPDGTSQIIYSEN